MLDLISPFNGHKVSALAPPHPRPASDDITKPEFVGSRQPQLPAEGDSVQHHRFISDTKSSEHLTSSDRYSVGMAEESRGKRRKQANPRRNQGRTHFMLLWYIRQDKKVQLLYRSVSQSPFTSLCFESMSLGVMATFRQVL